MPGADAIIAETLARIEHKLDVLLHGLGFGQGTHPPLGFTGVACPICKKNVEYQIDLVNGVVMRKCGCSTGKSPPLIPLFPVEQPKEKQNGRDAGGIAGPAEPPPSEDRDRRQGR